MSSSCPFEISISYSKTKLLQGVHKSTSSSCSKDELFFFSDIYNMIFTLEYFQSLSINVFKLFFFSNI